jgi:membrane-associated phospholipid phosphatase
LPPRASMRLNRLLGRGLPALVICATLLPGPLRAQEGREFNNALKDIVRVWSAPARIDSEDLAGIAAVAGGTGLALLVDEPIMAWVKANPNALPVKILTPFREGRPLNTLGRSYFLVGTSAALYIAGMVDGDVGLRDAGRGCASSVLATTVSRHFISRTLGRSRPRRQVGAFVFRPGAKAWEQRSFPGGHGANAMSCVTFWNRRFDLGAAEPVLYGLAGAVGVGRIIDEAHWTSDTVFGLSYGHAVGRDVAHSQQGRDPVAAIPESFAVGITISF